LRPGGQFRAREANTLAHRDPAFQHEGADLVDDAGALRRLAVTATSSSENATPSVIAFLLRIKHARSWYLCDLPTVPKNVR
jgi:hypothetical protein